MEQTIAQQFASARARAGEAVKRGGDGVEVARALSADVDSIVNAVAGPHLAQCPIPIAILATGGFGRCELAPYSDLDLLVLCPERPGREVSVLAEAILYPLWDAKVDAGHAVRSFDQALALPASDLAAATALLDARFLIGDSALADRFLGEFRARVAATAAEDFVSRLRAEQRARHSRFGDTIFLLEPDLKNGPGGMRDLCVGRWAAMARFGTSEPRELQAKGVMNDRLAVAFQAAREWLLRVRIAVHDAAGRRQDQLRFAMQEAVAPVLCRDAKAGAGDIRPAVAPAVEALMHQFHAHAKVVRRETERLLQRATLRDDHRRTTVPVVLRHSGAASAAGGGSAPIVASSAAAGERDPSFVIRDGALEPVDESVFERQPSEMIRIFSAAIELDVPLALRTRELIAERAAAHGEALRADPDTGRRFVAFLSDTSDRSNPSRIEEMQDLGLLAAIMPEWEPSTGRVQHDIYHVYTVDQHALYAVGRLHALARGELSDEFPVPSETIQEVQRPIAMVVGTLLHDVGKPYGKPHSDKGADLTVGIARRLGLDAEDIRRAEFLVRQHLVMGQMSQRRDLDDLGMIADFAKVCGDEENLRELYLLTFCDLSSVAPDNLTGWKETLLRDLYQRTLNFLRRGPDLLGAERAEIVHRRQRRAAKLLGDDPDDPALEALWGGFPDRYFAENTARKIAAHIQLIRARRARKESSIIDVSHQRRLGITDMVLAAVDAPGLLAEVTGVLHANRIDVVDAAIYSRESGDPGQPGDALDVFRVRDSLGRAVTDEVRWRKIREDLEAVLSGRIKAQTLVASRPKTDSVAAWRTPEVPTELKIDNDVSRDFTVVEVITEDRAGVLYAITRTLFDQGLDIHRSKIATEANRAVDVFYVRDKASGEKVTHPARIAALRAALAASLPGI
jgi:[protein-PII] uridylyltransferase